MIVQASGKTGFFFFPGGGGSCQLVYEQAELGGTCLSDLASFTDFSFFSACLLPKKAKKATTVVEVEPFLKILRTCRYVKLIKLMTNYIF